MIIKATDMDKRFPTITTGIRPLSCVKSLMIMEDTATDKRFVTVIALIRPFSSMNFIMITEAKYSPGWCGSVD